MTISCFLLCLLWKLQKCENGLKRFCDLQVQFCNSYTFVEKGLSTYTFSLLGSFQPISPQLGYTYLKKGTWISKFIRLLYNIDIRKSIL